MSKENPSVMEENSNLVADSKIEEMTDLQNYENEEFALNENDQEKDNDNNKEEEPTKEKEESKKKKTSKPSKGNNAEITKKWKKIASIPLPSEQVTFKPLSHKKLAIGERSYRSIKVPGHRMMHMQRLWKEICDPIITQLKLQIRMNSSKNLIEIRVNTNQLKK
ncbi:hypothetical protein RFI_20514 [Reticulomyxa filosa]|uniref:Uncharacterized protein n=1 Tax=Reticulomyxa filosa TaxID=46433 RepID=X6MSL6_RETFI|nr:hypothetical protein RFI_20514 [Reticulomyxa filosa]|eukprot:ETO16829.1 hypothetical protein RFI_20514 [Reticulomyxa filosa]